ncbi:MAG: Wzz/FepE/Etk N-terminal domain-containing protein [Clostridiales bacterium]|nr:Wzz/FepE/Etk N-terminal domain-containing protein [Clostridiales bacterium]
MKDTRENEIEIDLLQLFWVMKRRLWIIILAVVVGAAASMLYTTILMEPVYTSSTMIYILNKTNNITSLSDLQLGTQLTKDYKVLITSRPVLEQVTENLGLNIGYQHLNEKITVNNPTDTRILTISAKATNPETARAIADEVASVSVARIAEIMDSVPPKIIETGNLPTVPTSPSVKKNTVLGGLAAGIAAAGVIILLYLMNDSIRNAGDIEYYLDLNTLGQIPEFEENMRRKKKRRWGRRAVK